MDYLKFVFVLVCLVKYSFSQSKPGVIRSISSAVEEPKILVPTGTNTKTKIFLFTVLLFTMSAKLTEPDGFVSIFSRKEICILE